MRLELYNTMGRRKEEFVSIKPGEVGLYTCGPTVYNYAHIGNLRTFIFEDVLKRMLTRFGYRVRHVMNITDVGHLTGDGDEGEDKLSKAAKASGKSAWDIAAFYTEAFFKDLDGLNIIRPSVVCRATDHIADMIALIQRLEAGGHTYISGGNVYFSIDTFPDYGKLAGLDLSSLRSGARIEVDSNKRNPKDFVLWFTRSKFGRQEMMWDSPWGLGYPGWHIECSAMSIKHLGERFDIHCGGVDAIPVHHTNEIAQSEAATGKVPWVRYWLHGEFLLMGDTGKMSKSGGNFITLPVLVSKGYDPLDYRYFCLGAHYRRQLVFSYQALDGARAARLGLAEKVADLARRCPDPGAARPLALGEKAMEGFDASLAADMNMPRALACLWGTLKDGSLSAGEKLAAVLGMDQVLGLGLARAAERKAGAEALSDGPAGASAEGPLQVPAEVRELLERRAEAKKARNWEEADKARDRIGELGFAVKDTPQGAVLVRKL